MHLNIQGGHDWALEGDVPSEISSIVIGGGVGGVIQPEHSVAADV